MSASASVAVAVTFVWLGMVVAISFIEAPLKFRAPEVTVKIGLGIGRLVFRAINTLEVLFAIVLVAALAVETSTVVATVALAVAVVALVLQLALVRPRLTRRSDAVLAGEEAPRSRAHHFYIALETVKAAALTVGGVAALVAA